MNAQWLGDWDLGPRAHPGDALLDVTDGAPAARRPAQGPAPGPHRHPPAPSGACAPPGGDGVELTSAHRDALARRRAGGPGAPADHRGRARRPLGGHLQPDRQPPPAARHPGAIGRAAASSPRATATLPPWTSNRPSGRSSPTSTRRAELLVDVSHRIHEHPELGYEEVFAHDLLTEVIADEGLEVEPHAYGVDTAFVGRAGTERPDDGRVLRVRRPARHRPRLRAQHHRRRRARAPGWPPPRWPTRPGGRVVILGTPAEEGGGGKVRLIDAGAFDGRRRRAHGAPGRRRPAVHERDRHPPGAGDLPRPGRPRRRLPLQGPQRPRRRRARLRERGRPAPAHPPRRAPPRHLHRGGRQAQHRPGPRRGRVVRAGRRRCAAWSSSRRGWWPACEAGADGGRLHHGARLAGARSTPTCATTCPWSTSTRPTPAALGRHAGQPRRHLLGGGQHRHGQRQLRGAQHPPDDRRVTAAHLHPHPRVRRLRRGPEPATRPCSTGPRPWP